MSETNGQTSEARERELDQLWVSDQRALAERRSGGRPLAILANAIHECNVKLQWADDGRTFGDDVALIHSEVSEMLEAYRDWGMKMYLKFESEGGGFSRLKPHDHQAQEWIDSGRVPKPEGVGSEAADILIRLLDFCHRYDIDVWEEAWQKVAYNFTRPVRHGGKAL